MKQYCYRSPLGLIRLVSDQQKLRQLTFVNEEFNSEQDEIIGQTIEYLDCYFSHKPLPALPPYEQSCSPFASEVYELTATIPYGTVRKYGEIASLIAQRRGIRRLSAQAVGQALKKNQLMIIIPCHRVIGADGEMVGFAGGIERKRALLAHEGFSAKS